MKPEAASHRPMIRHTIAVPAEHRVLFTRSVFDPANPLLADFLQSDHAPSPPRVLALIDAAVAAADPGLTARLQAHGLRHKELYDFQGSVILPGGEACKNDWSLVERVWEEILRHRLDRHSQIWIIGGGAFLDMAGFAASVAHRGVRHVRFPTTTLSQGDGGVGVKNGVNYFGRKNWIGCFSIPLAIINDFDFLDILPEREKRAGLIEAVKVALIRDRSFFEGLEQRAAGLAVLDPDAVEYAVSRSAEMHCTHIATSGDPFEKGSARPLDFGHWAAHKLEQISKFRINHGEAVAIGMALDLRYGVLAGLLGEADATRALDLIQRIGFQIYDPDLRAAANGLAGAPALLEGLEEFREHLGGELTVTMVTGIGERVEIHEMDPTLVLTALDEIEELSAAAKSA